MVIVVNWLAVISAERCQAPHPCFWTCMWALLSSLPWLLLSWSRSQSAKWRLTAVLGLPLCSPWFRAPTDPRSGGRQVPMKFKLICFSRLFL